ncbi:uncharacterized protein LOC126676233 [Mercurialis annua]|uniref:uncharacterized protein LOC126676233 n=1 Tax=Mercurialis annua TaxID=3986 RepID=UPI00215FD436|nr:uncharacterized protein LOC126676233 [Mercurialis annua]
MEAIFAAADHHHHQSISPYKQQIKNPSKRNNNISRGFISRSAENSPPPINNSIYGGVLFSAPPSLSNFSPYYPLGLYPNPQQNFHHKQPPLLPLPISRSHSSLPSPTRNVSYSPNRKTNRPKYQSLPLNKPKQPPMITELKRDLKPSTNKISSTTVPLGPNPNMLSKNVSKGVDINNNLGVRDWDQFTGSSVYTISPPPSSLPMPKFSVRPKTLSCTAEAAATDAGATDNLRRLLRLRSIN